jgi:hypothetical protein
MTLNFNFTLHQSVFFILDTHQVFYSDSISHILNKVVYYNHIDILVKIY